MRCDFALSNSIYLHDNGTYTPLDLMRSDVACRLGKVRNPFGFESGEKQRALKEALWQIEIDRLQIRTLRNNKSHLSGMSGRSFNRTFVAIHFSILCSSQMLNNNSAGGGFDED
jgi:hypothetical protein